MLKVMLLVAVATYIGYEFMVKPRLNELSASPAKVRADQSLPENL